MTTNFIVLEGMDGCGKSTQVKLLAERLYEHGHAVVTCYDPGTTVLSNELRDILKYRDDIKVTPFAEALLFLAARAQLIDEVIAPALQKGHVVICDRFDLSTYVYQPLGAGLTEHIIYQLGVVFQQVYSTSPLMTFVLDLPAHEALSRLHEKRDKIENRGVDYFGKVRARYQALAKQFHSDAAAFHIIDAAACPADVHEQIWRLIPTTLK